MSFCGKIYKLDDNGMATAMGMTEDIKNKLASLPGFEWTGSESGKFTMGDAGITILINRNENQTVKSLDMLISGRNHPYEFISKFCADNGWVLHDLSSDGITDTAKVAKPQANPMSIMDALREAKAKVIGTIPQPAVGATL